MPKGPFLYWSKNGTGPNAWLKMLGEHYTLLSATYLQKGKKREAELFTQVADEFAKIQKEALDAQSQD